MLDLLLLVVIGLLFFRGWLRGLIREAISLAVVVVGTFLALRLSGAVGSIFETMLGTSADISRIIGGVVVFLVISIGSSVVIHVLQLGARFLPGATTLNRLGGALFSAGAGLIVLTLVFSLLTVLRPSQSIDDQLDGSAIVSFLTNGDGVPQAVLGVLAGDRILATALRLRDLVGEPRLLATELDVPIPTTPEDDVVAVKVAEERLVDRANRIRVRADLRPLNRAPLLDHVALERAIEIATTGRFSLLDEDGQRIEARIAEADLRFPDPVEIIALGATAPSINDAIEADETALVIVRGDHRRIGAAAVRTVNGLVAVVIYSS